MEANGKRKREDEAKRPAQRAASRRRVQQEELEEEFAATYHGLTAMYKYMEVRQLQNPLFLPRTLSYRSSAGDWTNDPSVRVKKERVTKSRAAALGVGKTAGKSGNSGALAGAMLKDFKIGMTAQTVDTLKRANHQTGLVISAYAAKGESVKDNEFTLVANCLIPVPCAKDVQLPASLVRPNADVFVLVFQVVDIANAVLASQDSYAFTAAPVDAAKVLGKHLLTTSSNGRTPLFAEMLRIGKRRTGHVSIALPAIASDNQAVVKIQFQLRWDALPKDVKIKALARVMQAKWKPEALNQKLDTPTELTIPKTINASTRTQKGNTTVWFHYLYHSLLRRVSEKRSDYTCAWCDLYAGSLRGLVAHLVSSHSHFRFQAVVGHDNTPHIYVMPLASVDALTNTLGTEPIEEAFMYLSTKKAKASPLATESRLMTEFDELEELSGDKPQEFYSALTQRQYFHSRTGAVVLDHEKDYDSDDDVDEEWIIKQSEKLLDEFEDVALEEKEFMKKWNRHVKENRILADFMVASSCRLFAKKYGQWLVEHGLRHNFLLHLFNLWDNSLLNSRAIIDCMIIVDHVALQTEAEGPKNDAPAASAATAAAIASH